MTRRRSRLTAAALLATTGALVLAGCAIPLPQVEAEPAPEGPQPALDEPRTDRQVIKRRQFAVIGAVVEPEADGGRADPHDEDGEREQHQPIR